MGTAAYELIDRYRRYLTVERGLTAGTARGEVVRPFVESRVTTTGEVELWDLSPEGRARVPVGGDQAAVAEVGEAVAQRVAISAWVMACPGSDRPAFGWGGAVSRGVAARGSAARARCRAGPRVVDSCDRSTAAGMRDFAILTMLVRLGMRRGEVAGLRLDDIEWRAGEIVVRECLPRVLAHPTRKQLVNVSPDLRRRRSGTSHGVGPPSSSCRT